MGGPFDEVEWLTPAALRLDARNQFVFDEDADLSADEAFFHNLGELRPAPDEVDGDKAAFDLQEQIKVATLCLEGRDHYSLYLDNRTGGITIYSHQTDRTFHVGMPHLILLALWRGIDGTKPIVNMSSLEYPSDSNDDDDAA